MRGINDSQNMMFSYFSAEQRVPAHHPLRAIKDDADKVLAVLSPTFDAMYSRVVDRPVLGSIRDTVLRDARLHTTFSSAGFWT